MKLTKYFQAIRTRPGRAVIKDEWILRVIAAQEREHVQAGGRGASFSRKGRREGVLFYRGYKP